MASSRSAGGSTATGVRQRLAERLPADASVVERARELAVIQDEQGYLAETVLGADGVDPARRAQLRHPPRRRGHAAACQAELELFRELLGTDVERETHIAAGDRCCTYRIGGATD